jgi:hypothetical protein
VATGLAVCGKALLVHQDLIDLYVGDNKSTPCKMLKKIVSKAADESKLEAYAQGYVEDFDESRTKLAAFFSILPAASLLVPKDSQRPLAENPVGARKTHDQRQQHREEEPDAKHLWVYAPGKIEHIPQHGP